jgi:hypothetical protein
MTAAAGCIDSGFARACERGEVPASAFHHADHLRLALVYLCESESVESAAERMAATLRAFAARAGHPEKYHHTLTLFWIHKVAQLLDKELPAAYYSEARLSSPQARSQWVDPDRRPLDG